MSADSKNYFGKITEEIDVIGVDWDEVPSRMPNQRDKCRQNCARLARTMEARHAEEMAQMEQALLEVIVCDYSCYLFPTPQSGLTRCCN